MIGRISPDLPDAVQRILVWCALGCALSRQGSSWRLTPPDWMRPPRGPAPKPIQDRTAQAAIRAGAVASVPADLFGRAA
ncbi:hypothetical protein [Methylobacterium sp. A54F]